MDDRRTRTDDDTAQLAAELADRVRALNHLTAEPTGLTQPDTVYTVLGSLGQAVYGLGQTVEQLDMFLDRELSAGRLEHHYQQSPTPAVLRAHNALADAANQTKELSGTLGRAQTQLNAVHGRETGVKPPQAASEAITAWTGEQPGGEAQGVDADFPTLIGEALPLPSRDNLASPEHRPSPPQPPSPRRSV